MTSSNESLRPASSKALGVGNQANLRLWWRLCLRSFTEFTFFFFFFFGVDFGCFFCFWGVWCFRSLGGKKRWWKACWKPCFSKSLEFSFLRTKHSRKVFIFQFLLGQSGEAPEMKSHVWKLRLFCCLKLGESSGSSAKVLQQRAKHRARSKELLEEVATREMSGWIVTFDTLPKTGGTFSDPLGRSMN